MRRVLLPVLAVLLVLGLAGGGALHVRSVVAGADRSAPVDHGVDALTGASENGAEEAPPGRSHTELSALLLPYPKYVHPGPDIGEWGNDAEISGEEATAMIKDSVAGMPRDYRRDFHDWADRLEISGVALRSYASPRDSTVTEIVITAYGSAADAEEHHERLTGLVDDIGVFRSGPKAKDYPDARCHLQPQGEDMLRLLDIDPEDVDLSDMEEPELDSMFCTAVVGERHVLFRAYGGLPLPERKLAGMLTDQLDHLESPGTYV
ncbi:hypothetical protein [Streptomyces sp. YIM 98790]|uniref:hypothetical protein n=1 Tax=Streptomyces sp. YIM 98790 TaxID=2689077 RepID=UPI00140834F2|nr:hypothetical protein [Streptomyces sp. YIM 98790]